MVKRKNKTKKKQEIINTDLLIEVMNKLMDVGKEYNLYAIEWKVIISELESWNEFNISKNAHKVMGDVLNREEIEDAGYVQ